MFSVLGIESSCDDSAVAVVTSCKDVVFNMTNTQLLEHAPYVGVVPEIAARSHLNNLPKLLDQMRLQVNLNKIDAIAVTSGPGLVGGLIVGIMIAKSIAHALNKPIIEVNHLAGHALCPRLIYDIDFPYLLLLVSGGHCQILKACNSNEFEMYGTTVDDAIGEAFDKLAKVLGLGFPGGPIIEQLALIGDCKAFDLPKPMLKRPGCDMSFSGLKTAVRKIVDQHRDNLTNKFKADICASFQKTILLILEDRLLNAFKRYGQYNKRFVVSGGVAANKYLRNNLTIFAAKHDFNIFFPPIDLCTDNGAMIAWAGVEKFKQKQFADFTFEPKSRWPL